MFNLKAYLRLLDVLTRSRAKSKLAENTRRLSIVLAFENSRYWWRLLYIGSSSSHTTVNPGTDTTSRGFRTASGSGVWEAGYADLQLWDCCCAEIKVPPTRVCISHVPKEVMSEMDYYRRSSCIDGCFGIVLGGVLGSRSKTNRECHRRLGVSDIRFDYNDSR